MARKMRLIEEPAVMVKTTDAMAADEKYQCCFCCHVRTGTLCIGIFYLCVQLVAATLIVMALVCPPFLAELEQARPVYVPRDTYMTDMSRQVARNQTVLESSDGPEVVDADITYLAWQKDYDYSRFVSPVTLAITSLSALCTCLLLYGVVASGAASGAASGVASGTASGAASGTRYCLLPFILINLVELVATTANTIVVGDEVEGWNHNLNPNPDMPDQSANSSSLCATAALVFTTLFVILVKVYILSVVWSCYKYLGDRDRTSPTTDCQFASTLPMKVDGNGGNDILRGSKQYYEGVKTIL